MKDHAHADRMTFIQAQGRRSRFACIVSSVGDAFRGIKRAHLAHPPDLAGEVSVTIGSRTVFMCLRTDGAVVFSLGAKRQVRGVLNA